MAVNEHGSATKGMAACGAQTQPGVVHNLYQRAAASPNPKKADHGFEEQRAIPRCQGYHFPMGAALPWQQVSASMTHLATVVLGAGAAPLATGPIHSYGVGARLRQEEGPRGCWEWYVLSRTVQSGILDP